MQNFNSNFLSLITTVRVKRKAITFGKTVRTPPSTASGTSDNLTHPRKIVACLLVGSSVASFLILEGGGGQDP